MAIALPQTRDHGSKALGIAISPATADATWAAQVLTANRGLLECLNWGDTSAEITVAGLKYGGVSMTSGGAAAFVLGTGKDMRAQFFGLADLGASGGDLVATYSNDSNAGIMIAAGLEVTGHNTSSMLGNIATSTDASSTSMNLTTTADNSAIVLSLCGGSSETANVTIGGSAATRFDHTNAQVTGALYHLADVGAAGVKAIAWDALGYLAYAIEIKAAVGGGITLHAIERGRTMGRGFLRGV